MKIKELPLFYKIYYCALTAFLLLLIIFAIVFYNFIASYNEGIHETVSKNFFEDVFLAKDINKILEVSGIQSSKFESTDDVKSFISKYLDGNLSYTYVTSNEESDNSRKYIVKSVDYKIATFSLSQDEKNDYYPSSLTLHLPKTFETEVQILSDSTLYINGVRADKDYIYVTYPHKNAEYLPENVPYPIWAKYKITGLTKRPEIVVKDRNGNTPVLTETDGIFCENILPDPEEKEVVERLVTAAKEYAKCMQFDAPKNKVLPYFEKGTPLYEDIKTVENMFVWDHAGYSFEDEEVSDFMRYDENTVSVRVAFTHILKKYGREDYKDRTDITYFAKKIDGKYLIYDRYNNKQ